MLIDIIRVDSFNFSYHLIAPEKCFNYSYFEIRLENGGNLEKNFIYYREEFMIVMQIHMAPEPPSPKIPPPWEGEDFYELRISEQIRHQNKKDIKTKYYTLLKKSKS
jgi:hypothetical protein